MIESVQYQNFKVLRDTTLPLGRFTLMVGANGSGKSTALQAFQAIHRTNEKNYRSYLSLGVPPAKSTFVDIILNWGELHGGAVTKARWAVQGVIPLNITKPEGRIAPDESNSIMQKLERIRVYSLNANVIASSTQLQPDIELRHDGAFLAGVLDRLRDRQPERFEALNKELSRWLPEFDRILFDTPSSGHRAVLLRTSEGHHLIKATDLSQGTLLALAILTIAYLPEPPAIVCFEEPDRGIHPRLLRDVRDALYRLAHPESFGEKREPVQVIATTHSPYFLDLFKERSEEIVIAHKTGLEARFERLSDRPDIAEVLGDAPLGEVWYSGILGGVPPDR
jgi:predicted ATPase